MDGGAATNVAPTADATSGAVALPVVLVLGLFLVSAVAKERNRRGATRAARVLSHST